MLYLKYFSVYVRSIQVQIACAVLSSRLLQRGQYIKLEGVLLTNVLFHIKIIENIYKTSPDSVNNNNNDISARAN